MRKTLLIAVLALIGALAFSQERIAVFPFEDMDNIFTRNESILFYREFSNEFANKNAGRIAVIPRQEVEKLINIEAVFQLGDFSARAKTAEMNRVLNGTQILSGLIGKVNNNIRITVSLYTYPELQQLRGGATLSVANKTDLFDKIPELVQNMQGEITRGGGGVSYDNVPNSVRRVLGSGYDLTGRYANSSEVKRPVLDLDRLSANNRVERDSNIRTGDFKTVTGKDIKEYTKNLATEIGRTAGAGAAVNINMISFSGSFSREVRERFSSDLINRSEYEFATGSSIITRDAFFIRNQNLTPFLNQMFVNDVKTMTAEQIISRYGTHVMLGAVLGARLDHNIAVKRKSQTGSTTISNLVSASFDARIMGIGGGVSNNRELENKFGQMFDVSGMQVNTKAVGGSPELAWAIHNDRDYNAWIASVAGNEVWTDYYQDSLVPIYDFITDEHFGAKTQELKANLRNAINRHLDSQGGLR